MIEALGYQLIGHGAADERAVYMHPEHGNLVTIDREWASVYYGDPVFNCLRRDLGISAGALRKRLATAARLDD